jgi:hypothetical protein
MSTIASLQLSKRAMGNVAAAVVTAGVALAALTAPAMAAPFDTINIDSSNVTHEFQFGDTCTAGAPPTSDGDEGDWRERGVPPATVSLRVRGNLCLQNTTAETRVSVEAYQIGALGQHILLSRSNSQPSLGNGGSLNQFAVDVSTPRLSNVVFTHAHAQIQERVNGQWQNVPGGAGVISYP